MSRVAGIQIEKDSKGRPAYARINLKKHSEYIPHLEKSGAIVESKIKMKHRNLITGDELRAEIHRYIDKKFDK